MILMLLLADDILIFQRIPTNKAADDNPLQTLLVSFEAYDDHAMTAEAPAPPVMTVLFADFPHGDKSEVAIRADVVVAFVAF